MRKVNPNNRQIVCYSCWEWACKDSTGYHEFELHGLIGTDQLDFVERIGNLVEETIHAETYGES